MQKYIENDNCDMTRYFQIIDHWIQTKLLVIFAKKLMHQAAWLVEKKEKKELRDIVSSYNI